MNGTVQRSAPTQCRVHCPPAQCGSTVHVAVLEKGEGGEEEEEEEQQQEEQEQEQQQEEQELREEEEAQEEGEEEEGEARLSPHPCGTVFAE